MTVEGRAAAPRDEGEGGTEEGLSGESEEELGGEGSLGGPPPRRRPAPGGKDRGATSAGWGATSAGGGATSVGAGAAAAACNSLADLQKV